MVKKVSTAPGPPPTKLVDKKKKKKPVAKSDESLTDLAGIENQPKLKEKKEQPKEKKAKKMAEKESGVNPKAGEKRKNEASGGKPAKLAKAGVKEKSAKSEKVKRSRVGVKSLFTVTSIASKPEGSDDSLTELPSLDNHPELKAAAEKCQEQENSEQAKENRKKTKKVPADKENKAAIPGEKQAQEENQETEGGKPEKVKVKRSGAGVKKKAPEKKEGSYISLADPKQDDKVIEVPSLSARKKRGVVYLSHIPHGFFEKEMRAFFKQFGTVTNLRLGRSKKTGASKGFAFVEFKYSEVAKIVSETMNNYLMFNKIVKCALVPKERMSPKIFYGKVHPLKPPGLVARRKTKQAVNLGKSDDATVKNRRKRQTGKLGKVEKRLAAAGAANYALQIS